MRTLLSEFKEFLMRANIVELAIAVVIGAAFGALVTSLVANLLTPLIAAIFGETDFSALSFTVNNSTFTYGAFINSLITFASIAAAIFVFVVKPVQKFDATRKADEAATTTDCPHCLSAIPTAASRCAFCTSEL